MTAVRNRPVIARLADREHRAERPRNRWVAVAVALSSFLLVTVLSVGVAYVEAVQSRSVLWAGMDYDAFVKGPTAEQISTAASLPNVALAGVRVGIGTVEPPAGDGSTVVDLDVSDPTNWEHQVVPALERFDGRYPEAADEIALSTAALERLEVDDPQLGMHLDLGLRFRETDPDAAADVAQAPVRTFTLVGVYRDQTGKAVAYGSSALQEESGIPATDKLASTLYLTLDNPFLDADGVARLSDALGVQRWQNFHADDSALRALLTASAAALGLVLLVGASAALVVHTLLTVWLGRQVRVYGLLATVGTTGTQLRRIVRRQVVRLGVVGAALGVVPGALVTAVAVPRLLDAALELGPTVSPAQVLVAVVPATLVVVGGVLAISARGPLRTVARLTPVEALRHVPAPVRPPRALGRVGSGVVRLAGRALARDRRRTATVVCSFALALLTCLTATALVASNDSARVLDQVMPDDVVLLDQSRPASGADVPGPDRTLDAQLLDDLRALDGVEQAWAVTVAPAAMPQQPAIPDAYYVEYFDRLTYQTFDDVRADFAARPEEFRGSLVGIDEERFAELNRTLPTPVDADDFHAGRVAILSSWFVMTDWDASAVVGQDVSVRTTDGVTHTFAVAATTTQAPVLPTGVSPDLLVDADHLASLVGTPLVQQIAVDYERSYDRETEAAVHALVGDAGDVAWQSRLESLDAMRDGAQQIGVLGLTIAGVLMLVALVNFASAMVATAHARARELALLEAVGGTGAQLRRAAVLEGLGYWALAVPVATVLAVPVGAAAFGAANQFHTAFTVPVAQWAAVAGALAVVCVTVPLLALRAVRRGAVIDRLR